ncbi:hypothetical protein [uncultured Tenacibaculum sp.]|uniref:hypothetical protein n=1 Tax=uncultured Tenacibaculum sp. TaxID=174713 RepID=UPI002622112F|nr:hypothetical protein [uncultured Tenacibaculum sp.]
MSNNNLKIAMKEFGKLSQAERELFLSVITPQNFDSNQENKIKTRKSNKSSLPFELTEDYFFQELVKNHNKEVRKRLSRNKNKIELSKAG